MTPTVDEFQALARSAPWRFRTAHVWVTGGAIGHVEAHLERPGLVRYRAHGERWRTLEGANYASVSYGVGEDGRPFADRIQRWARDAPPILRPDGLVAQRPSGFEDMSPDDPMVTNYSWVAMLDPVELSHHVQLSDLTEVEHHGRRAWRALAVPVPGYEPRCGCCALLWSRVSDQVELDAGWDGPPDGVFGPYPESYGVTLDHATGMLVSLVARPDIGCTELDVRILEAS